MKTKKSYVLTPCAGNLREGLREGHLYSVKSPEGKDEGWMELESAKGIFGEKNISVASLTEMCPGCAQLLEARV